MGQLGNTVSAFNSPKHITVAPDQEGACAAQVPPDDAVEEGRLRMRGPLNLDGLSEAGHVDVQVTDEAGAADAQRWAVGAVVDARLAQRSLPSDQHPLAHMHRLPAHACTHSIDKV